MGFNLRIRNKDSLLAAPDWMNYYELGAQKDNPLFTVPGGTSDLIGVGARLTIMKASVTRGGFRKKEKYIHTEVNLKDILRDDSTFAVDYNAITSVFVYSYSTPCRTGCSVNVYSFSCTIVYFIDPCRYLTQMARIAFIICWLQREQVRVMQIITWESMLTLRIMTIFKCGRVTNYMLHLSKLQFYYLFHLITNACRDLTPNIGRWKVITLQESFQTLMIKILGDDFCANCQLEGVNAQGYANIAVGDATKNSRQRARMYVIDTILWNIFAGKFCLSSPLRFSSILINLLDKCTTLGDKCEAFDRDLSQTYISLRKIDDWYHFKFFLVMLDIKLHARNIQLRFLVNNFPAVSQETRDASLIRFLQIFNRVCILRIIFVIYVLKIQTLSTISI